MKKLHRYLLVSILSLGLLGSFQYSAQAQELSVIHVTGYAEKELVPDMAFINLGMETSSDKLEIARGDNATAMNRLLDALKQLGLAKENLTTTGYRVAPRYDKSGEKINGYTVNNTLKVKVMDLQLLPKIIQIAGANGINQINQIQFSCANMATHKAELLQAAIANGRFLATTAANAAGSQLGKIKELRINGQFPSFANARTDSVMLLKSNAAEAAPVLEQGVQKASESVEMTFYIQ